MRIIERREEYAPIAESGERWTPRPLKDARDAMSRFPAGGTYLGGEPWDGITHLERRLVFVLASPWKRVKR